MHKLQLPVNVGSLFPGVNTVGSRRYSAHYFGWRRGVVVSGVCRMNEVNARRARIVLSVGSFVIKTRFAFLLVKMDLATDSGSEYDKDKKKIGFHFFLHV